ncbi:MAG: oligoendopeptidase F [bacterium]|nr:oligoendopeptidase F [bacterium]
MSTEMIPERKDIPDNHKWDLTPMFKTDEEWEKLYTELEGEINAYAKFQGRLHESLAVFKEALDFDIAVGKKLETLYTYSHLKNDEDKTDQKYEGNYQRAVNLYTRISEQASYMSPEIQSIPEETMNGFLKDESIKEYGFYLEKLLRYKPHTKSKEIEEILAMSTEVAHAPSQIFSQLDNADMKFGTIKDETGKEVELSHGNFSSFLINPNRELREKAFFQYYQAYDNHKNTVAATLGASAKKDHFFSKVRNFENCRRSALFSDNVPDEVYDNLISSVRNNFAPIFKYLDFRKKALGLKELHFYDTYVPIVKDVEFTMPYEEAVDLCIEALQPLGEEYLGVLKEGLLGGWVDRYENKGKRSGAYSSGCYTSPPYILLNYKEENINSVYTLIHEAGHSMHTWYATKNQPYIDSEYTIFVAEVASTFNETLLSKFLLNKYKDDNKMRAYILNREIDNIRGTLYRQTMFAEFEKISHNLVEQNQPLTLDTIRDSYRDLLKAYFGETMVIDEVLTLEALRIPHFYSPFYVYKYSTGISAAIALADKVMREGEPARNDYLNFLKLGGSMFPLEELRAAGVDMGTPAPIEAALAHMGRLVDELIEVYEKL